MNTRTRTTVGWSLTALVVLFLLFDTSGHIARLAVVLQAFDRVGMPESLAFSIGVLELVCVVVYLVPRTAMLGALLLTGYLGGATAIQVRAGSSAFETIFPVLIALTLWAGFALRDSRVNLI